MRYLLAALLLSFSSTAVLAKTAPNFTIPESSEIKQLSDLKGKVVYLDFWASWCVPCRKSFPWMNSIQKKYSKHNFKLITVNLDKESKLMNDFLKKFPANFIIVQDKQGAIARQYQLQSMPSSYIIDINGEIIFKHNGFLEKNKALYQQEIESLLNK